MPRLARVLWLRGLQWLPKTVVVVSLFESSRSECKTRPFAALSNCPWLGSYYGGYPPCVAVLVVGWGFTFIIGVCRLGAGRCAHS